MPHYDTWQRLKNVQNSEAPSVAFLRCEARTETQKDGDVTDLIGVCPCATASFRIAPQRCSLPLDTVAMINRSNPGNFIRNVWAAQTGSSVTPCCVRETGQEAIFKTFNQQSKHKAEKVTREVNTHTKKQGKYSISLKPTVESYIFCIYCR